MNDGDETGEKETGRNNTNPLIPYPCAWIYTVIGSNREAMRRAVKEVFQERACNILLLRTSAAGNYCSLRIEAEVYSDDDRKELFARLSSQANIKIVL